jgi:hypothetical protein
MSLAVLIIFKLSKNVLNFLILITISQSDPWCNFLIPDVIFNHKIVCFLWLVPLSNLLIQPRRGDCRLDATYKDRNNSKRNRIWIWKILSLEFEYERFYLFSPYFIHTKQVPSPTSFSNWPNKILVIELHGATSSGGTRGWLRWGHAPTPNNISFRYGSKQ